MSSQGWNHTQFSKKALLSNEYDIYFGGINLIKIWERRQTRIAGMKTTIKLYRRDHLENINANRSQTKYSTMMVFPLYCNRMQDRPTSLPAPKGVMDMTSFSLIGISKLFFLFAMMMNLTMRMSKLQSAKVIDGRLCFLWLVKIKATGWELWHLLATQLPCIGFSFVARRLLFILSHANFSSEFTHPSMPLLWYSPWPFLEQQVLLLSPTLQHINKILR
jgi:hypothetical protein